MSFDDHPSFGKDKLSDIGGRDLPAADTSESSAGEVFNQSKLEGIGGRSLPKPQQGASTLEVNDIGNVAKLEQFPN